MKKPEKQKRITSNKKPEKSLIRPLKSTGGRGAGGRITSRHRGGGVKRRYRLVDFGQGKIDQKAIVEAIEYDPNRSAHIALVQYESGEKAYIIAPHGLKAGDKIEVAEKAADIIGNRMMLKNIPLGTFVHNVEIQPGGKAKMARSAGSYIKILSSDGKNIHLQLPSSEVRIVNEKCFATIGTVSNPDHKYRKIGKAGINRKRGKRPHVRGSAMNPVDHPHGGGEGRTGIGLKHPKTPWGKIALGPKTRKKKKWTNKFIIRRRKKK